MKTSRTIISAAILVLSIQAGAQDFSGILYQIENNNATLAALRSELEASIAEAHTGLAPDDPELELGYLWANPSSEGNRLDISFTQTFDFPTAYLYRKRMADGECSVAELKYQMERRQLLLEAEKLCIEITYHGLLGAELQKRYDSAKRIAEAVNAKFEAGSSNVLENNKAKLNCLAAGRAVAANKVEMEADMATLVSLNGGKEVDFPEFERLVLVVPDDFDSWFEEVSTRSPELAAVRMELANAQLGVKLARSEWLPKFSVGYVSERQNGTTLQGIGAGISIPLWANRGKVKAAKAREAARQAAEQDECLRFYNSLHTLYLRARSLSSLVADAWTAIGDVNTLEMMDRAYESGQMPLADYVLEQSIWSESITEVLEQEKELCLLVAQMNRY